MNIPNYYRIHKNTMFIQTYNIINCNTKNMLNTILTNDRNINLKAQNKCSSFNDEEKPSFINKKSYETQMRHDYNKLDRGITLAPNIFTFKKLLKKEYDMKP